MESIIGLFKTECIPTTVFHDGPYKTLADVEYATAGWVDWYNHRRLHGPSADHRPSTSKPTTLPSTESRNPYKSGREPGTVQGDPGPVTAEQVRDWCGQPRRPDHRPTGDGPGRAPPRQRLPGISPAQAQTQLRDGTCVFPFCFRPAEKCDCEHRVAARGRRTDLLLQPGARTVDDTTARRPPAAGPMSPSNPASTSGAAPWATSSSATRPAPSTSPPTPNAAGSPTSSAPTSATDPNPDHPAPHPAPHRAGTQARHQSVLEGQFLSGCGTGRPGCSPPRASM